VVLRLSVVSVPRRHAWRHYITESLRRRMETGYGTMLTREEDQAAVRQHAESR
jgi:hypothetical protein